MRAIAQDAGVSTGNAYYYFGSKEELIQQFYVHNQAEHLAACRPVLDAETDFAARLGGTLNEMLRSLETSVMPSTVAAFVTPLGSGGSAAHACVSRKRRILKQSDE